MTEGIKILSGLLHTGGAEQSFAWRNISQEILDTKTLCSPPSFFIITDDRSRLPPSIGKACRVASYLHQTKRSKSCRSLSSFIKKRPQPRGVFYVLIPLLNILTLSQRITVFFCIYRLGACFLQRTSTAADLSRYFVLVFKRKNLLRH